jgi:PKD repeat protein
VIEKTIELPQTLEDNSGLAVEVVIYDFSQQPSLVANQIIGFKLDRNFPTLSTLDDCNNDGDCLAAGEACDLVTNRCVPAAQANIGTCRPEEDFSGGLSADFLLEDNLDDSPTYEVIADANNGCQNTQRIRLQDDCGNTQIINIDRFRAPNQDEVIATLNAYRCVTSPCTQDDPIADGDTSSRVNVDYALTSPFGCYDVIETELEQLAEDGTVVSSRELFSDEILQVLSADLLSSREITRDNGSSAVVHGGPFQLTAGEELTFTLDDGSIEIFTIEAEDFFNLDQVASIEVVTAINRQASNIVAYLDDIALRIRTRKLGEAASIDIAGSAATSLGFTAAFNSNYAEGSGDGTYRALLNVYACGGADAIISDALNFSISMPFEIELDGPYVANEGEPLSVSAEDIFVSQEIGGISKIEWDLNGDGVYELEQTFDPAVRELPAEPADPIDAESNLTVVNIDTQDQLEVTISMRITTGLNEQFEARADVLVNDLIPSCALPQEVYNVNEGAPLVFDAPDTVGHPSDALASYEWNFGDGEQFVSIEPSIQHIYVEEGEYILTLDAVDEDGSRCPQPATARVIVGGVRPIIEGVGLSENSEVPLEGRPVTFTSGGTRAGAASDPLTQYTWTFGYDVDGVPVNLQGEDLTEPPHTYADDGEYSVCLTVEDTDDTEGPSCFSINVADLKPTVIWNGPIQGVEGQPITFDATGTVAGGDADLLTSIRWDFSGSPEPVIDVELDDFQATHTFNGDGQFTIRVTAFDEDLDDDQNYFERQIEILDVSPTANFEITFPDPEFTSAIENEPLELNANASLAGADSDPIVAYIWDFGDGEVVRELDPVTSHSWPDGPRDYIVSLTVEDSDGSTSTTTLNISVVNADPEVTISASQSAAEVGSEVSFSLNVDDVVGDQPGTSDRDVEIEWDMGDGTLISGQSTVNHIFEREGNFVVSVRFNDGDGGEAEASYNYNSTPRLAELDALNVVVTRDDGTVVGDPANPINEFEDNDVTDDVYYLREGDEISISINVISARLSNGTLDSASARWSPVPEGSQLNYVPVRPAAGEDAEGTEEKRAVVTWTPNFFQAGTWQVQLAVEGEETGSSLTRSFELRVAERGTPMLATTSGSLRRGRVVLYRYDLENGDLTFTPSREVNVGFGAYDVVADQERRRLFVSSPLSGHVAVIGGDPARVIRYIPTGAGAYDMALGGNILWTVNAEDNTLSAIDLSTLKVKRTVALTQISRPLSVHWVTVANDESYVLVGGGRNGKLLMLDAQGILAGEGEAALKRVFNLGQSLIQIASYDDHLWISDGKKRRLYKGSISDVVTGDDLEGDPSIFTEVEDIPFTTTDILPTARGLWVATGDSLSLIDNDGFLEGYERPAERLIAPHPLVIGGEGITVSNGLRIDNFRLNAEGDLEEVIGIEGSRVQKLTTFVQYSE